MFKSCERKQGKCPTKPAEKWVSVNGGGVGGSNGNRVSKSKISEEKLNNLIEVWKQKASNLPDGAVDIATNPTADEHFIYNSAVQADNNDPQGLLTCTNRHTGEIKWRRLIKDYSGINNDRTNAAPLLWEDYLFFGSSIQKPQTMVPYENTMVRKFSGLPVSVTGAPMRVYCVNKHTGDLVWESKLGNVAQNINDLDNWATITQSPVMFKGVVDGTGVKVPFLAIGTSSLQSFQPWFISRFGPFGLAWGEEYGQADGSSGFQCTDVGRVFYLDPFTGTQYAVTHTLPPPLQAGQVLEGDSLNPGEVNVITRHVVTTADISGGGLDPVNAQFAGEGLITYVLEVGGFIPQPLNGVIVVNTNNIQVALVGGNPVTPDLDKVVVPLTADFDLGTTNVTINAIVYQTTDPTTGLDGVGVGLRPARINKILSVGDVLDTEDAYGLSYWGGSVWNNAVNKIPCQSRLVITNGQLHAVPYQDSIVMQQAAPTFIQSMGFIKDAQEAFELNPTDANFEAMQQQYSDYVTGVDSTIVYTDQLSARGRRAYFDSAIIVSIGNGVLGDITDVARSTGYDQWQLGYIIGPRSAFVPGWSDVQAYYERPAGGDLDFGQGAYFSLYKGCTYVILVPKGGIISVYDVSTGSFGNLAFPKRIYGNPTIVGASSFGSVVVGHYLTFNNSQAYNVSSINAPSPSVTNYPPQLRWYVNKDDFYEIRQSSIATIDILTGEYQWQRSIIETPSNDPAFTVTQFFGTKKFVFVISGDGFLRIFSLCSKGKLIKSMSVMPEHMLREKPRVDDSPAIVRRGHMVDYVGIKNSEEIKALHSIEGRLDEYGSLLPGRQVKVIDVNHAGQSSVLVLDEGNGEQSIYVYSGRERYSFYGSPSTNYSPTEVVFCLRPDGKFC